MKRVKHLTGLVKLGVYKIYYGKKFSIGKQARIYPDFEVTMTNDSSISIGNQFCCRGNVTLLSVHGGKLELGDDVSMSSGVSMNCMGHIKIGNHVRISPNVFFYDHDHKYNGGDLIKDQGYDVGEIEIGDNVWIGTGVIIFKGAKIGAGSVIAAGSIIKKSVPENSVVFDKRKTMVIEKIISEE